MKPRIIKTCLLLFFLLFLCGCYRNYDVYGYKKVEKYFNWGVVGAKLRGSEYRKGNTILKSSPYELFLWFGSEAPLEDNIYIKQIKLINKITENVAFEKKNVSEQIIKEQKNFYRAYFSFEDIKMPYENMELQITFRLEQEDSSTEYKANLLFKKDHQKFRRIIGV